MGGEKLCDNPAISPADGPGLARREPTGGSVMGSVYPRGRIYWLKDDTIPREMGRAGAIREPTGTET